MSEIKNVYAKAYCCKEWQVVLALDGMWYGPQSLGRCGVCGQFPGIDPKTWETVDAEAS